jgi:hypothetical protein
VLAARAKAPAARSIEFASFGRSLLALWMMQTNLQVFASFRDDIAIA